MEHFTIASLDTPQEEYTMFSFTYLNEIENHHTFINQLYYIVSGSLSVLWRGKSFTLRADDVFFIPSDEFCIQQGHLCWVLILCLPSVFLSCENWKIRCCSGLWSDKGGSNYEPLKQRLAFYIREQAKSGSAAALIRKLLLALGAQLSEQTSEEEDSETEKKRKTFHEILEYINQKLPAENEAESGYGRGKTAFKAASSNRPWRVIASALPLSERKRGRTFSFGFLPFPSLCPLLVQTAGGAANWTDATNDRYPSGGITAAKDAASSLCPGYGNHSFPVKSVLFLFLVNDAVLHHKPAVHHALHPVL